MIDNRRLAAMAIDDESILDVVVQKTPITRLVAGRMPSKHIHFRLRSRPTCFTFATLILQAERLFDRRKRAIAKSW